MKTTMRSVLSVFMTLSFWPIGSWAESKPKKIAIDSGHTAQFPGSIGTCGTPEVWVNDRLSEVLGKKLEEAGFEVYFTRQLVRDKKEVSKKDGREPRTELLARAERANQQSADLLLSIHHDSVADTLLEEAPDACAGLEIESGKNTSTTPMAVQEAFIRRPDVSIGFSSFIRRDTAHFKESLRLAKYIGDSFLQITLRGEDSPDKRLPDLRMRPSNYHRLPIEEDCQSCKFEDEARGVMSRKLALLEKPNMPAVLIEVTNLRIPEMERSANNELFQAEIAEAIVFATLKYFEGEVLK